MVEKFPFRAQPLLQEHKLQIAKFQDLDLQDFPKILALNRVQFLYATIKNE